ncbi:MAG TPA: radical SAM protein [Acidobacteriota bacterium]|nr:radical SAM protein [Acidobacteriota bacterium]
MKKQVVLVNPKMSKPRAVRLPISLLSLGAVLEGEWDYRIVDGNVDPDAAGTVISAVAERETALVGMTVMPGPQVAPAIEIASALRAAHPEVPVAWGGYFPTLYPDSAVNAPYVDYLIRGQGEDTLRELLQALPDAGRPLSALEAERAASAQDISALSHIAGLTYKAGGRIVHNPERHFRPPDDYPPLPYRRVGDVESYLRPSFMGKRTAVHQAALGCRYRCTFCGVVSMFNGYTQLQAARGLRRALLTLRDTYRADAVQFYDHNFFDKEKTSIPVLEVLEEAQMPWWCYARADTLAKFSTSTWERLRRSRLKMAYIGAEAASDSVLKSMRKGTKVDHTFETARLCKEYGVIPEFSFVLGGPEDPEGEIEKTFGFIRRLKAIHPECEIVPYFYSPTPQRDPRRKKDDGGGARIPILKRYGPDGPELPTTPEEWTEPRWLNYVCHQDAPWLTPRMRQRVRDFAQVISSRFPTGQDYHTPQWGKSVLRNLARWRYAAGIYGNPWELRLARRWIPLRDPAQESL